MDEEIKKKTFLDTINALRYLLTRRDKVILVALFFMTILYSLVETSAVGIIMPFITLASRPEVIVSNPYSNAIYEFFGFSSTRRFMVVFAVGLIIFYVFRVGYSLFYNYLINRFAYGKFHFFAYRLFSKAIELNYSDFVKKRTDRIRNTIVGESMQTTNAVRTFLQIFGELFTVAVLYILLLITSWKMTIALTIIMGLQVFFVIKVLGGKIRSFGETRLKMDRNFQEIITKTFGNFKIIKLKGNQRDVQREFESASESRIRVEILTNSLSALPKGMLEFVGFAILIGCVIYILMRYNDVNAVLPIVSMYALALYRVLPAVTRILDKYNSINYASHAVYSVYENFLYHVQEEGYKPCIFEKDIELKNISFGYKDDKLIFSNLNLHIKKGEKVAFCGKSGVGKSTLVDIIMGIYKPQKGQVLIDGVDLNYTNLRAWRQKIGYIPQTIYLFYGSVAENVAFGSKMDESKIKEACRKANILDFLEEHEGIYTNVGEGGILLSGGQKQRIGIARAIYNDPEILVLDEATSSLDVETESKIMDEIYSVAANKTLLVIAHRLNTIERCEKKIEL